MLHILKYISKLERCPHMYTVLMSIFLTCTSAMLVARYKKYFINSIVGTGCSGRATLAGVSPVADLKCYLGGYIQGRREGGGGKIPGAQAGLGARNLYKTSGHWATVKRVWSP